MRRFLLRVVFLRELIFADRGQSAKIRSRKIFILHGIKTGCSQCSGEKPQCRFSLIKKVALVLPANHREKYSKTKANECCAASSKNTDDGSQNLLYSVC